MFENLIINRKKIGEENEQFACQIIGKSGLKVIAKNYHCKMGEIDIIARDKSDLIFIEVRYRKSNLYGGSLESVDLKKQKRIVLAANHYLQKHKLTNKHACRFDVFAITGTLNHREHNWIKGAFQSN